MKLCMFTIKSFSANINTVISHIFYRHRASKAYTTIYMPQCISLPYTSSLSDDQPIECGRLYNNSIVVLLYMPAGY